VGVTGALLAGVHLRHGLEKVSAAPDTLAFGTVIPGLVSVLVLAAGYRIAREDWPAVTPWRVVGWFIGGAAVGVVLIGVLAFYQAAEGVILSGRGYVIAMFATYGGAFGLLVGRYDADRRAQQVRQRAEARRLEEFASVVSHDLRNPLNVATARLELAHEECSSDHLEDIGRALDRMDALIGDLLALARAGEAATDVEAVTLASVARAAWGTVETDGATLAVESDATLTADRGRLRQLLENLFGNAVEHGSADARSQASSEAIADGPTGPPPDARAQAPGSEDGDDAPDTAVTVTVGVLDDGDGFYVADDGPGIDGAERDRIFEAGYSTASEGTGFGLSIVRKIAGAHGWSVRAVESEAGGVRFEFTRVEMARA